jgi:hydroxyacylglutathione hydrolase
VGQLRLIGLDNLAGYWDSDAAIAWAGEHDRAATMEQMNVAELRGALDHDDPWVLDVRNAAEVAAGAIDGSHHIPLGHLQRRIDDVPANQPVIVHCQSGIRSAIATSILLAAGRENVVDVLGGFNAWQAAGHPVTRASEPVAV